MASKVKETTFAARDALRITAVCRIRLHQMIAIVGHDFVYCDTDSCKALHPEKYEQYFTTIKKEILTNWKICDIVKK